jgi:hypothetical protein
MKKRICVTLVILFFLMSSSIGLASIGIACTGFTASDDNKVLVGTNEDNRPTRRYVEIHPPGEGKYGKIYFIYDGFGIQQIVNDQGLFWDGFWAPHLDILEGEGKPPPYSWMIDEWMDVCSTVNEIIDIFNSYDWRGTGIEDAMLFFVDRYGNSAIIEGDEIVYKEGSYQAVTNYYQTHPELGGYGFDRYDTAIDMLENMDDLTMEYFRDICDATHQEWPNPYPRTIYSLVCDVTNNKINYYYEYNYIKIWEIDLAEMFEFGEHTYDVLDFFNNNKPNKPDRPDGPSKGAFGIEYEYSVVTTDEDDDQVYYKWDFGDGNISGWLGPYDSGEPCQVTYTWMSEGQYQVRVRARDTNTGRSDWSDPLGVSMPKCKDIQFPLLKWFLNKFELFFSLIELILDGYWL